MKDKLNRIEKSLDGCHFPEVHQDEDLMSFLQLSIDECDAAIETIVDSFMHIYSASSRLAQSDDLNDAERLLATQISLEVPTIISALQFQDRLKQRFTHVRLVVDDSQRQPGSDTNRSGVQMDNHMSLLEDQSDGIEITLFSEAA